MYQDVFFFIKKMALSSILACIYIFLLTTGRMKPLLKLDSYQKRKANLNVWMFDEQKYVKKPKVVLL